MNKTIVAAAPLFPLVISLIVGILTGECLQTDASVIWSLFAVSVVLTLLSGRWVWVQSMGILTSMLLLGMLLVGHTRERVGQFSYDEGWQSQELVVISEGAEKARTMAYDVLLTSDGRKLKCYLQKEERSRRLKPGDGLVATVRIEENADFRSGHFDYHDYLLKHGFAGSCYASSWQWQTAQVSLQRLSLLTRSRITFLRWRHTLLECYRQQGAADDTYAILAAMTLGDKTALSKELREVYSMTGASHVLALSGLHLGILYLLLSRLVLGRRRSLWAKLVLLTAIWSFAFLVGLPVSVVRAAVMLTVFTVFSIGGRTYAPVNVLCFAALLILLQNPYAFYDVGFQLSFLAVLSIFLLMPLFDVWVSQRWQQEHPLAAVVWGCVAISIAAQLGTAPLVAYHFGRFSCYFLLTNFLVIPAAYLILLGTLLMLLVPIEGVSTGVLWVVEMLNKVLGLMAQLPGASIEGLQPSVLQTVLLYVAFFAVYLALLRLNNLRLFQRG